MTALRYFETAAKHVSFTGAANELGVTLGAISRQIKLLENDLNTRLFERTQRGVKLTDDGLTLYKSVSYHFDQIRNTSRQIRHRQHNSFNLATTSVFATLWLLPRLEDFWQRYPDIAINHQLANNMRGLNRYQSDLYIRYGGGFWVEQAACRLFTDKLYPVCSPEYAKKYADKPLSQQLLLQMFDDEDGWTAWEEWLTKQKIKTRQLHWRHFNSYIMLIGAAERGQGIAMGWHSLISDSLAQGKLQACDHLLVPYPQQKHPIAIETPGAMYLTWAADQSLSIEADLFRHWLLERWQKSLLIDKM